MASSPRARNSVPLGHDGEADALEQQPAVGPQDLLEEAPQIDRLLADGRVPGDLHEILGDAAQVLDLADDVGHRFLEGLVEVAALVLVDLEDVLWPTAGWASAGSRLRGRPCGPSRSRPPSC